MRWSFRAIGQLARMAREADVVHYHFPYPFTDVAHFLARVDKPAVVTYHSDIVRQKALLRLYQPLQHRFLDSVDTIVATSAELPGDVARAGPLPRQDTRDHLSAWTSPAIRSRTPRAWRAGAHASARAFFLFVGVLRYYKGLHILLDAVAGTDYPVVIVGAGPIEQELKDHARALGLKNVLFVGALDEMDKVALLKLCYARGFPRRTCARKPSASRCSKGPCSANR